MGTRPYNSIRRREQAERTRREIVGVATRRFLDDGYAATTIAAVAADAGVSVETIYKIFGGKPGLVRAIRERALEGSGPVPAETRSDALHVESDPRVIVRGWGRLTTEVAPLVAPILLLVRDAATSDEELRALRDELDNERLTRMTHNAQMLFDAAHLRPDVSVERAAQILWTYSSPELYERLVLHLGWDLEVYGTFVADAIIAALLPAA